MARRAAAAVQHRDDDIGDEDYYRDDEQGDAAGLDVMAAANGDAHLAHALADEAAKMAPASNQMDVLTNLCTLQSVTNRLLEKLVAAQVHAAHESNSGEFFVVSEASWTGSLNALGKSTKRSLFSHVNAKALVPKGFADGADDVILTGLDLTYVDSDFPCSVGLDWGNIESLPKSHRAESGGTYHYVVARNQHTESPVPLMGMRAGVKSDFLDALPGLHARQRRHARRHDGRGKQEARSRVVELARARVGTHGAGA